MSVLAGLLVFSGLFGYQDVQGSWAIALGAAGGLGLLAIVSTTGRYGGDSLLAGALLLLAGSFLPYRFYYGGSTLGIQTFPGAFAAVAAIAVGVGWYYWWAPPLLALFIASAVPTVLLLLYNSQVVIGPYVVLVACVALLGALALGTARPAEKPMTPQDSESNESASVG